MKKKLLRRAVIGFAVLLTAALFTVTACGDPEGGPTGSHTHSYSTAWSYNATHHWHECTAGDGAKADEAVHNGTAPCSVCGYDLRRLQIPATQVYGYDDSGENAVKSGPIGAVTESMDSYFYGSESLLSDYFTGSVALTNGKISVDLMPKDSEFPGFVDYDTDYTDVCAADVKGIIFESFGGEGYYPSLFKIDENDVLTHMVVFIYVDRDLTFTGDTYYHKLTGLSVKKGWNYISQNRRTFDCEVITDLSGYEWINWE